MRTKLAVVVLSFLLFFTTAARAADGFRQPNVASGLDLAIKIFGPVREAYFRIVVDPAVRAQSLHRLRVLSNRLEALALAKQEFTDELKVATWPGDQPKLRASAFQLQDDVWRARRALGDVFEPLPDDLKKRGGEIQRTLEGQFSGKWNTLRDIASELKLSNPSTATIHEESEAMLKTIRQMRELVDGLIDEISKKAAA